MEGIWKTLAAPIVTAVVAGIVVGVVLTRLQGPELPTLTAQSRWIQISNPYYSIAPKSQAEVEKLFQSLWGSTDIGALIESTRFHQQIRLVSIEINNDSRIRSKEIEISSREDAAFFSTHVGADSKSFSQRIKVKPIDPNGSARVFAILSPLVVFGSPAILALHDGKQIEITHRDMPDEFAWLFDVAFAHPYVAVLIAMLMPVVTIIAVVLTPFLIAAEYNPELKFKLTNKKELGKLIRFLDFVKERHPENYATAQGKLSGESS